MKEKKAGRFFFSFVGGDILWILEGNFGGRCCRVFFKFYFIPAPQLGTWYFRLSYTCFRLIIHLLIKRKTNQRPIFCIIIWSPALSQITSFLEYFAIKPQVISPALWADWWFFFFFCLCVTVCDLRLQHALQSLVRKYLLCSVKKEKIN